jgi:hypothetical protein
MRTLDHRVDPPAGATRFRDMPRPQRRIRKQHLPPSLRWSTVNYALMAAGIVSIALGFALLANGSTVAAPLLLALGYVVLIPLGIIS